MSSKEFYTKYVVRNKPCIFKGMAKEMPAFTLWNQENYLEEKMGDIEFNIEK